MKKYRFKTEDVEQAGKTNLVDILTSNDIEVTVNTVACCLKY